MTVPAAVRTPLRLHADGSRVIARLFVAGQEMHIEGSSRAAELATRIMALSEAEVGVALRAVRQDFGQRHRHLEELLQAHFDVVAHRFPAPSGMSADRRLLIGAYFTHEYAVEAAALFNPSIVPSPDQQGAKPGELRVVMSLRAVGEGHLSSVEFRQGTIDPSGQLLLDTPPPYLTAGGATSGPYDLAAWREAAADLGDARESVNSVLDALPERFTHGELEAALTSLRHQRATHDHTGEALRFLDTLAGCTYEVAFPEESSLSERLLWPRSPSESHGIEDARFVRFTDDDGTCTYLATYTAWDGRHVRPQLIRTGDFRSFRLTPLTGPAARNKGMALFPRRIHGRMLALSRWDRESIALAASDDGTHWDSVQTLLSPHLPWDLVQLGNCGSPIETSAGWLVLTHGVGPMRAYAIGAMLLDLDDPREVLAALPQPLLTAESGERDGYVPNVVYTCGALVHEQVLVIPYGASDASVGIATVPLPELLAAFAA